jgi:hypothetical protein
MSTCTGYIKFINKPDKIRKNWSIKMMGDDTLYISRKPLDMYMEGDEIELEYKTNKAGFNWIDTINKMKNEKKQERTYGQSQAAWRDSIRENLNILRDSAGTPYSSSNTVSTGPMEQSEDLPTRVGITPDTAARLVVIRKRTDTATNAEVVRNAIRLYHTIINEFDKGNELLPSYMLGAMGIERRES